jgi:hypothetical protein
MSEGAKKFGKNIIPKRLTVITPKSQPHLINAFFDKGGLRLKNKGALA